MAAPQHWARGAEVRGSWDRGARVILPGWGGLESENPRRGALAGEFSGSRGSAVRRSGKDIRVLDQALSSQERWVQRLILGYFQPLNLPTAREEKKESSGGVRKRLSKGVGQEGRRLPRGWGQEGQETSPPPRGWARRGGRPQGGGPGGSGDLPQGGGPGGAGAEPRTGPSGSRAPLRGRKATGDPSSAHSPHTSRMRSINASCTGKLRCQRILFHRRRGSEPNSRMAGSQMEPAIPGRARGCSGAGPGGWRLEAGGVSAVRLAGRGKRPVRPGLGPASLRNAAQWPKPAARIAGLV